MSVVFETQHPLDFDPGTRFNFIDFRYYFNFYYIHQQHGGLVRVEIGEGFRTTASYT